MKRPTPEEMVAFARAAKQYPEIAEYFVAWRNQELDKLPYAVSNQAVSQGRCQVLGELTKLFES